MLIIKNRGFKRNYTYGGSGMFDTIAQWFTRLFSSNAVKQIASTTVDIGKKAAVEAGKKAIDVGKAVAIAASKRLVEKVLSPKSQQIINKYTQPQNINNLIDGSAIAIQDLVKKLNGSGMKII